MWNHYVNEHNGSLLQTETWGALKSDFGWDAEVVRLGADGPGALTLYRTLPVVGSLAYIPRGPVIDWMDTTLAAELLERIGDAARKRRAAFLKVEPNVDDSPEMRRTLQELGFRESPQTVQPPRTILIDVDAPDDEIMARMNQGTRRKIRLSGRREVDIREGDAADVDSFTRLTEITGERNEFGTHDPAYYARAFALFAPEQAALLMASYEGTDLAGLMVFRCGRRAYYLYGASSNKERRRMATYGLQWAAIQWARAQGCETYDLWGIPDEDEETLEADFTERSDGLWGVYGFKRGFGGRVVRSIGAWDLVYNPIVYAGYQTYLKVR